MTKRFKERERRDPGFLPMQTIVEISPSREREILDQDHHQLENGNKNDEKVGEIIELQPVKPITYSVIKSGLLGLTRYLSTYWVNSGIRCNALSPGGIFNGQSDEFVKRISSSSLNNLTLGLGRPINLMLILASSFSFTTKFSTFPITLGISK